MVRGLGTSLDAALRSSRRGGGATSRWHAIEQCLASLSAHQFRHIHETVPSDASADHERLAPGVSDERVILPRPPRTHPSSGPSNNNASNWGPRRFTNPQGHDTGNMYNDKKLSRVTDIDTMVSRLATEALQEVQRLKSVDGFANEETRRIVWQVMRLFREIVRDQSERQGQAGATVNTLPSPAGREASAKLNETIQNLYASSRGEMEKLESGSPLNDCHRIVGGLLSAYKEILEQNASVLNATNISTMLHRTATIVGSKSLQAWTIREHTDFLKALAGEVSRRLGLFDPQGYATVVWSFGKLGPGMRSLDVGVKSFDRLMEDLMEVSRRDLTRFTLNDSMNIVLGLAELGTSQHSSWAFLRGLSRVLSSKASALGPGDIAALLWAFAKLKYTQCGELVSRMCDIAEHQMDQFDPAMLGSFLRGLVIVEHNGTPTMMKAALAEIERRIDEYDLQTMSKVVWALLLLSYHPGEVIMNRLGDLFCSQPENLTHQIVTATILALAHCGEPHHSAIDAAKAHFMDHISNYRSSDICKFLWSLSMLDALDSDLLKAVEGSSFEGLSPHQYGVEGRRQLCQILISWRILNNQPPPGFVTRELEEGCYSAWRAVQRTKTTFGLVPEVLEFLKKADFECRSPLLIEKIPLSVTSAVREKTATHEELKLILEVATRAQNYHNRPSLQKPRQRWRQRILEALGWTVIRIPVDQWNKQMSQDAKAGFLRKLIYERTSVAVDLSEFGGTPHVDDMTTAEAKTEVKTSPETDETSRDVGDRVDSIDLDQGGDQVFEETHSSQSEGEEEEEEEGHSESLSRKDSEETMLEEMEDDLGRSVDTTGSSDDK
ncbi:hypothetical protein BSKO_09868 [Bryopsis sp. KO-2023]|nr:hypothetical protein BSKO_09868 [Bryopsis sp. KO-2023]